MKQYDYNRGKEELLNVINSKAPKKNISFDENGEKVSIKLIPGNFPKGEDQVPIQFSGKIYEDEEGMCHIKGHYGYGFNLSVLVVVAILLIVARLSWSIYKMQVGNIVLCGIVTVLLALVVVISRLKGKGGITYIDTFLKNLNLKGSRWDL